MQSNLKAMKYHNPIRNSDVQAFSIFTVLKNKIGKPICYKSIKSVFHYMKIALIFYPNF